MGELAIPEPAEISSSTLFGTDDPVGVLERAASVARPLEGLLRQQKLVVKIGQSEHVKVEGWTLLGSMLGVFPVVQWTRPVLSSDGETKVGWEARVEAQTLAGKVVGSAEAECLRDERTWKTREDYALRSMAQTRAVSKALRLPLGFVMQIAGFSPTPAEEMPRDAAPPEAWDDGLFPPVVDAAPASRQDRPFAGDPQRTLLWTIVSSTGVSNDDFRDVVERVTGQRSTKLIRRDEFQDVLNGLHELVAAEVEPATALLLAHADEVGKRAEAAEAVKRNRETHGDDLVAHVEWLKAQIANAEQAKARAA